MSGAQVRYRSWEIAHSMPPIDVAEHEREQQAPQARNAATGQLHGDEVLGRIRSALPRPQVRIWEVIIAN